MEYFLRRTVNNYLITILYSLLFVHNHVQCLSHTESFEISSSEKRLVDSFVDLDNNNNEVLIRNRRSSSEDSDKKCDNQKTKFLSEIYNSKTNENGTKIETKYTFDKDNNLNLALAWASQNDDGVLIAVTAESGAIGASSILWRSKNHGRDWVNINDKIYNAVIRKGNGVQRNPHNAKKIYLLTNKQQYIYVTEDGGKSWNKRDITGTDGELVDELVFHPSAKLYEDYILTISDHKNLFVTSKNWRDDSHKVNVHSHISNAVWGTDESGTAKSVFCMIGKSTTTTINDIIKTFFGNDQHQAEFRLCQHDVVGTHMTTLLEKVHSFGIQGKFLYASVFKDANAEQNAARIMKVSTNAGKKWNIAQLPSLTDDRFYMVLDMSEELIFMHVDNPGNTGHGTLFTSASEGILYSKSLDRHLYPNVNPVEPAITDFYKVESIRGVYFASQIDSDDSIHSMITFNRGAIWQPVPAPNNVDCKDKLKGCYLQIHNKYSIARGIKAKLPLSIPTAKGLVLVHGHVADALQTTEPDIFLTTNGGYSWKKVLDGPHAYQIANSGSLLVAVSLKTNNPRIVKFSTDEGNCWHEYEFTQDDIKLTGLLTEPGGKSMIVSLWGYHSETHKWTIFVIDFNDVITNLCKDKDYETWKAHETLRKEENEDVEGCLLGQKQSFKKLKPDSWCHNTYNYKPVQTIKNCKCTREDYECEYGFGRPVGSDKCVLNARIHGELDICENEKIFELISNGYRKIPGDVCKHGFEPKDEKVDMKKHCSEQTDTDTKDLVRKEEATAAPIIKSVHHGAHKTLITVLVIIVLITIVTLGSFFLYKLYLLRKHKVVYRYSLLAQNQNDNQDFDANLEGVLTTTDSLYNDDSDEEQDTAKSNGNPFEPGYKSQGGRSNGTIGVSIKGSKSTVKSYHDDSDDDLLN